MVRRLYFKFNSTPIIGVQSKTTVVTLPGSHGAGLPSETFTPFVLWGAGAGYQNKPYRKLSADDIEQTRFVAIEKYKNYLEVKPSR